MDRDYPPLTELGRLHFQDGDGVARMSVSTRRIERTKSTLLLLPAVLILVSLFLMSIPSIAMTLALTGATILPFSFIYEYRVQPRGPLRVYDRGVLIDRIRWPLLRYEQMSRLFRGPDGRSITIITGQRTRITISFDTRAWRDEAYMPMHERFDRAHKPGNKAAVCPRRPKQAPRAIS